MTIKNVRPENLSFRKETDPIGEIQVATNKYWGAQTQRALEHFGIGSEKIPLAMLRALGLVKKAAAITNHDLGLLPQPIYAPIIQACDEVIAGQHDDSFPLTVWQSGSGTQTNMNCNEVIANRAIEIMGGTLGSKHPIHPNDHVNLGQSSNDCFATAMHISALEQIEDLLLPALCRIRDELWVKEIAFAKIIKIGRTHLMDAIPITLGQEFSGYHTQIQAGIERLTQALAEIRNLAQGATAVGTGQNTHPLFAKKFIHVLNQLTNRNFNNSVNKFAAIAAHDTLVFLHGTLKTLAVSFMKIANDIRWLGSGPRCGIGELILPQNEPGSSIMPGKVNPFQCESMLMVCCQVFANDTAMAFAGAGGNFELNTFKPVLIYNFLNSVRLLADSANNFVEHCLIDLVANETVIAKNLENSLMLVTALSPHIGYDKAASIAKLAYFENLSLKAAAEKLGYVTTEEFQQWVRPQAMV